MNHTGLPEKLKELREAHGYKQVDVASAIGVARQTYSNYENGSRTPNPEMLYKIAAFYNISVNDLLRGTVALDPEIYYEAPPPSESGSGLDDYITYLKKPANKERLKNLPNVERELIYYFEQIDRLDQWELLEFAKILAKKRTGRQVSEE